MRKLLFIFLLLFSIVWANEICPSFSVAYIEDDGTFTTIECSETFEEARESMKRKGEDYVVRHAKSLSPTKIIAMNSGLAYTYSFRNGSSIQNIYSELTENKIGTGATTYLTAHYETTYLGTEYIHEFKSGYVGGWVKVVMNGFEGYADLEYLDLVPSKFIENGIPIKLGGSNNNGYYEEPYNIVCQQNYYEAVVNGSYRDLIFHYFRSYSTNGKDPLHYSIKIGVAPDFMEEGIKYYSNDGINYYSDRQLKNLVGIYYNYYQFLPARTKTNISAETINSFLVAKAPSDSILLNHGEDFIKNQNLYGVNGATILSMAIHESGWGTSNISKNKNNLFGWGAFDDATSNAASYNSVSDCIEAQMGDNLANYLDTSSRYYYGLSLGNKGGGFITKYASDPYWAEKISQYYYDLDKFSCNYDGNLTDYNSYTLALVKNKTNFTNNKGDVLMPTYNKNGYQKNVIVSEKNTDATKIQSQTPNSINSNEVIYPITLLARTLVEYNWEESLGFINLSDITYLNKKEETSEPEEVPTVEEKEFTDENSQFLMSLSDITIEEDILHLEGTAFFTRRDFTADNNIRHVLEIKGLEGNVVLEQQIETLDSSFALNDGFTYNKIAFKGDVDISSIKNGLYKLYIKVVSDAFYKEKELFSTKKEFSNIQFKDENDLTKRIHSNSELGYLLMLEVESTPIDYSSINKPETRKSMFAFDSLNFVSENDRVYLDLQGHAMIYYLNYTEKSNLSYQVYLIQDSTNFIEHISDINTCTINYSQAFNSEYDMSNICFSSKIDITDLKSGNYKMGLVIKNIEDDVLYYDFIPMSTYTKTFEPLRTKDVIYSIESSSLEWEKVLSISK